MEPGEVEAVMRLHPGLREAAVIIADTGEDKRMEAYVAFAPGVPHDLAALRLFLKSRLPAYMIPAQLTPLKEVPLTATGKIDYERLRSLETDAAKERPYVPPATEMETRVAAIWAEVLNTNPIGRQDNFFDLGGHSLSAVKAQSRIQARLGLHSPLSRFFATTTLEEFCTSLKQSSENPQVEYRSIPAIGQIPRSDRPPLSFAQGRLWFLNQRQQHNLAYLLPLVLRMKGFLDLEALESGISAWWLAMTSCAHLFQNARALPGNAFIHTKVTG